jgi:hypothetical protein
VRADPYGIHLQSAGDLRTRLNRLYLERIDARSIGLADSDAAYMADLDQEIEECRSAFLGAVVIEIAVLRAEVLGRQTG